MPGLVLRVSSRHAVVHTADGDLRCRIDRNVWLDARSARGACVVGDHVVVAGAAGRGADRCVVSVLPRETELLRRHGPSGGDQVMAANANLVLAVASAAEPGFRPRLVDRVIVAAEYARIPVAVVISKVDLVAGDAAIDTWTKIWRGIGYPVIAASTHTGVGIDELRALVAGRVAVVAGQSGVGKSSLLVAIDPALKLPTKPVSGRWSKGTHTTSTASLTPFGDGGWLVDTPGVRSFGLARIQATDIALWFREMAPFIDRCRFNNCTHAHEPECAVQQAVIDGQIDRLRYESYLRMLFDDDPDDRGQGGPLDDDDSDDAADDAGDEAGD